MSPIKKLVETSIIVFTLFSCNLSATDANKELLHAAAQGDLETVRALIKWGGADINYAGGSLGMTALHYALRNGNSKIDSCPVAKYFIAHHARLDIKGGFPSDTAQDLIDKGYCQGRL